MNKTLEAYCGEIADGLAGSGYAVVDHFLTLAQVETLLDSGSFEKGIDQFRKAGIGQDKQVTEAVRGDLIQWVDRQTATGDLRNFLLTLDQMIAYLNRELFLSLKDYEIHQTIYPAGSFYKRHLDQFRGDGHRKLSLVCYLNRDWKETDGGQLRLYLPDRHEDVFPTGGRLVCFRSDQIEHEVLPATRDRLSLTGWILDRKADVGPL